jgi:hypothetical protein
MTRYTEAQKAEAVGIAAVSGQTAASEQTGIPLSTIHSWWMKPEFAGLRNEKREAVAEMFWTGIQIGLKSVVEGFQSGEAKLNERAVALGILYDKHALLTGGATNRSESRDISGTLSDVDLIAAVREAEQITSGGGTPPAGEVAPKG